MGKHKHKFSFQSTDFINYIWSKRKILIFISVLAAIVSAIVSLSITPKFRSSVILFPASSASVSKTLLTDNNSNDFLRFGTEQEGEQLMQVLNSSLIKEKIIQKFNLIRHYHIDTTGSFWRSRLANEFAGNIKFHRTEYMSIVIDVLDPKPDTAALIANEISNQVDTVMSQIQSERAKKALAIVEKEYQNMVHQMSGLEDSLRELSKMGIINFKTQSKAFNEAYADAILKGNIAGMNALEKKLKVLAQYGGAYESLTELQKVQTERLSDLQAKYVQSKVDADQTVSHKFVVDKAYPSEKKAYPKRSLIVLVSTVCAFFMTLLLLILRDSIAVKAKE